MMRIILTEKDIIKLVHKMMQNAFGADGPIKSNARVYIVDGDGNPLHLAECKIMISNKPYDKQAAE